MSEKTRIEIAIESVLAQMYETTNGRLIDLLAESLASLIKAKHTLMGNSEYEPAKKF